MNLNDAQERAEDYMRMHGLTDAGWTFKWGRGKNLFGLCSHSKKTISLSRPLTELNDEDAVDDTILHEIAHALVPANEGHGIVWKRKCREIGAKPERTFDNIEVPEGKYTLECPNCGVQKSRHRKPKRYGVACSRCCNRYAGGRYDAKYAFRWYLTEGMVELYS